ncbi:HNH endonuclease [Duganella sp. CY15W]|uniref:HNH endonuclease n=1 Tax=Duganella sp. CY15W TaxID=2692172 RepID=UPI0019278E69
MKTRWRKVKGHTSIDNALYGPRDGAPGLFSNKVRINYVQHGVPLFVLVWRDGEEYGYVAKPDASESTGVTVREIPVDQLLRYEESGEAPITELQSFFVSAAKSAEESPSVAEQAKVLPVEEFVAEEGGFVLAVHIERERDSALAAMKKRAVLAALGYLRCEACDFDFSEVYGEIGEGFCEVHHIRPLSERDVAEGTGLEDLAVLCSNCHSIIHRTSPLWTVLDLRAHLAHVRWSRLNDAVAR